MGGCFPGQTCTVAVTLEPPILHHRVAGDRFSLQDAAAESWVWKNSVLVGGLKTPPLQRPVVPDHVLVLTLASRGRRPLSSGN